MEWADPWCKHGKHGVPYVMGADDERGDRGQAGGCDGDRGGIGVAEEGRQAEKKEVERASRADQGVISSMG